MFGRDRSIMKGSLHAEHSTFCAINLITCKVFSWKSIYGTGWKYPTKVVCLYPIGSHWRTFYMENTALSLLYLFPFKGLSTNPISGTRWQWPTKVVCLFVIGLKWRAVYMYSTAPYQLYLLFHSRDFPKIPYPALCDSGLQMLYGWSRLIYYEIRFTWITQHLQCFLIAF